jgi:hypothetical protein
MVAVYVGRAANRPNWPSTGSRSAFSAPPLTVASRVHPGVASGVAIYLDRHVIAPRAAAEAWVTLVASDTRDVPGLDPADPDPDGTVEGGKTVGFGALAAIAPPYHEDPVRRLQRASYEASRSRGCREASACLGQKRESQDKLMPD